MISFLVGFTSISRAALLVALLANVMLCAECIRLWHAAEADWHACADLNAKVNATGRVVYAIQDVPEGADIPRSALVEREIPRTRMPIDAITSAELVGVGPQSMV